MSRKIEWKHSFCWFAKTRICHIYFRQKLYVFYLYYKLINIFFYWRKTHQTNTIIFLHLIIVSLIIAKRLMPNFSISTCKLKESIWVILEFNNYISITTLHVCFLEKLLVIGKPWLEYKNIKNLSDIIKSIV